MSCGEIDSTLKKEQSALKAFLTSPEDDIREPYAKKSIRRPRTTSFCASVNPYMFLKDSTGNRRFWVIHTEKIQIHKLRDLGKQWVVQLWAQIYARVKNNVQCFRLTSEESEKLRMNNLLFSEMLPYEEELMEIIDFNSIEKEIYTNREIVEILYNTFELSNISSQVIGKTLNKISDNNPKAVIIKRSSKGARYQMKIKKIQRKSVGNVGNI